MSSLLSRPRNRLAGFRALFGLTVGRTLSVNRSPSLPTASRLRRDIGLPEIDPEPPIHAFFGRRL
ncbi:hypothetical protein ACRDNQ_15165 [Palleronia sp. KMU-117]|uniref:hypothetical protein n=1 Tax=Palleronia sp. KMU-117 TaxID=3434108 RepID=UPI003D72F83D